MTSQEAPRIMEIVDAADLNQVLTRLDILKDFDLSQLPDISKAFNEDVDQPVAAPGFELGLVKQ